MNHPDWCKGRNFADEKKMLSDHGFFSHMVMGDEIGDANFHTHGIPKSYEHPDIQITVALPPNIYGPMIHSIYDMIKEGTKFEVGPSYPEILQDMLVEFAWAIENDRDVLRMILPDQQGNTSKDNIGLPYGKQWVNTYESPQLGLWEVETW